LFESASTVRSIILNMAYFLMSSVTFYDFPAAVS
jgi:hypothetical protein